jgi:hypothetical protein
MEYAWPPASPISPAAVVLHVVLLALAVASFAGLFLAPRRPAARWGFVPWTAAIALAVALLPVAANSREEWQPFLIGYSLFVCVVCLTGLIAWATRRLYGAEARTAAVTMWSLLILGGCIFLSLPAVPSAREAARRTQCRNQLRQIGTALQGWHEQRERLPDVAIHNAQEPPRSWRVELLPFLGAQYIRNLYRDEHVWDHADNLPAASTDVLQYYRCPSNPWPRDEAGRFFTAYALVSGAGSAFPGGRGVALTDITDGTSQTLLVGEACGLQIVWTRPADIDADVHPVGVNRPGSTPRTSNAVLSSYHVHGTHAVFADGHHAFLSENISPSVLKALTTAAAGDTVTDETF